MFDLEYTFGFTDSNQLSNNFYKGIKYIKDELGLKVGITWPYTSEFKGSTNKITTKSCIPQDNISPESKGPLDSWCMFEKDKATKMYPQAPIKWTMKGIWEYIDILSPMIYTNDLNALYPTSNDITNAINILHNGSEGYFDPPPITWKGIIMPSESLNSQDESTYKIMSENGLASSLLYALPCDPPSHQSTKSGSYVVKSGDTCYSIADKICGMGQGNYYQNIICNYKSTCTNLQLNNKIYYDCTGTGKGCPS